MNTRKAVTWIAIAFVVFYVLTQPGNAGNTVDSIFSALQRAGNSLATFVSSIGT